MNEHGEIAAEALAEALSRLPREVEPPGGLWPRIEQRIAGDEATLTTLVEGLAREADPPADLWPRIHSRIGAPSPEREPARSARRDAQGRRDATWWSMAASLGAVVLVTALFGLTMRHPLLVSAPPSGGPQSEAGDWWIARVSDASHAAANPALAPLLDAAVESVREEYRAVRRERRAIERSLASDAQNENLRALWRHVHQAELGLADRMVRMIEENQRSYGI